MHYFQKQITNFLQRMPSIWENGECLYHFTHNAQLHHSFKMLAWEAFHFSFQDKHKKQKLIC